MSSSMALSIIANVSCDEWPSNMSKWGLLEPVLKKYGCSPISSVIQTFSWYCFVLYPYKDFGVLPLVIIRGGIAAPDALTHVMIVILLDFWLVMSTTDLAPRTVTTRPGVCSKFHRSSKFHFQ